MSWSDKRINIPFISHHHHHHGSHGGSQNRDVEKDKVLAGSLRKLKTMRKRWFVLYSASSEGSPAHLEYHDNENKWRDGHTPKRDIILKDCFNICKKQDTRDSKNKHVIAIYTLDDCLSILFEDEQDLQVWLIQLLSHQKGNPSDGRIPRPNFEKMWQIHVKCFKPQDPEKNTFVMSGPHRLVVTNEDLKFFPIGSNQPISFPIVSLRSCVCIDRIFQIVTGRSSYSGLGTLFIHSDDKEISANLNAAVLEAMEYNRNNRGTLKLPSHIQRSLKQDPFVEIPGGSSNSSSHRPRSESCSEIDKVNASKVVPKSANITHHPVHPTPVFTSNTRNRTISEGNHMEIHKRRGGGGHGKFPVSGSPMSPSPGSCMSSESAGSSNSLDDSEFATSDRRHASLLESQPTTIYEESSAESWIDPNANREGSSNEGKDLSKNHSTSVSHLRTNSDTVTYTPVDVSSPSGGTEPSRGESVARIPYSSVQYSTIVHPHKGQSSSSEYMAMTPGSGPTSATSSLKRNSSLDQSRSSSLTTEQRRLAMLGLSEESSSVRSPATVTSPSSQSSYNPVDDSDEQAYCSMSPLSSLSKPDNLISKNSANTTPASKRATVEEDEYMSMSPVSASSQSQQLLISTTTSVSSPVITSTSFGGRSRQNMAIPLYQSHQQQPQSGSRGQEYEIMSPVSIDQEKLRRISEEDPNSVRQDRSQTINSPSELIGKRSKASFSRTSTSKRNSFCSDGMSGLGSDLDDHFFSLQQNHPAFEHEHGLNGPDDSENVDYMAMDYSKSGGIPIPRGGSRSSGCAVPRTSPGSSSSLISGTPNSVGGDSVRFPHEFPFETKAVSLLRQDSDGAGNISSSTSPPTKSALLPSRAYTMSTVTGSSSASPSINRSRRGSVTGTSKNIDIPMSSSSMLNSKSKLSVTGVGHGHSPNFISRLDNWFRTRAGSVPTRPQFPDRRRHRTQSEGEKDSPENQEKEESNPSYKKK